MMVLLKTYNRHDHLKKKSNIMVVQSVTSSLQPIAADSNRDSAGCSASAHTKLYKLAANVLNSINYNSSVSKETCFYISDIITTATVTTEAPCVHC